jgi:hypothetical protein
MEVVILRRAADATRRETWRERAPSGTAGDLLGDVT